MQPVPTLVDTARTTNHVKDDRGPAYEVSSASAIGELRRLSGLTWVGNTMCSGMIKEGARRQSNGSAHAISWKTERAASAGL